MQLEIKEKIQCGAMGKLVNSEDPSDWVIKSNSGSKTENEIFITKSNVWGFNRTTAWKVRIIKEQCSKLEQNFSRMKLSGFIK